MATRSRTTFQKRQKELARLEKQRDKAARRMQRKLEKQSGGGSLAIDEENPAGEDAGVETETEAEIPNQTDRPE